MAKSYLDEEAIIDIDGPEAIFYSDEIDSETSTDLDSNSPTEETEELDSGSSSDSRDYQALYESYKERLLSIFGEQKQYIYDRLRTLNTELNSTQENFEKKQQKIEKLSSKLAPVRIKILSLNRQIAFINDELYLIKIKIKHAERQIVKKEDAIKVILEEIETEILRLKDQRERLKRYVHLLYSETQQFMDFRDREPSVIKLLLADNSFGENYLRIAYIRSISSKVEDMMYKYELVKMNLIDKEVLLEKNKQNIAELQIMLKRERGNLQVQSVSQRALLSATKGEERTYRELLKQTKRAQEEVEKDIGKLQSNIDFFHNKLRGYTDKETNIDGIVESRIAEEQFEAVAQKNYEDFFGTSNRAILRWPIFPKKGLSTYFKDESYPYVSQLGEHMAIDIPAPAGTPIHAPRTAVVGKIKKPINSSYAYIILIHGGNVMTVYGHVSQVMVKEGDLVQEGEIIALTGGQIGTKGAGWATTGPHLHFEVYKNGRHVDPLEYLPLSELADEYIPVKYREER